MKIIAFSDTHRRFERVEKLFEKTHLYADIFCFAGDGLDDVENMFYLYPTKPIHQVAGNCDWGAMEKFIDVFEVEGHKILLTHGHLQNAKYGPDGLLRSARDNGCDLVIFGHTHEKLCEYHDGIYLVNPGSLGHPHDGVPSYAVIDVSQKGILVSHIEL